MAMPVLIYYIPAFCGSGGLGLSSGLLLYSIISLCAQSSRFEMAICMKAMGSHNSIDTGAKSFIIEGKRPYINDSVNTIGGTWKTTGKNGYSPS
jgi:hypothetical protein